MRSLVLFPNLKPEVDRLSNLEQMYTWQRPKSFDPLYTRIGGDNVEIVSGLDFKINFYADVAWAPDCTMFLVMVAGSGNDIKDSLMNSTLIQPGPR